MRLINTTTFEFRDFALNFPDEVETTTHLRPLDIDSGANDETDRDAIPKYAILSHRWHPEGEFEYRNCMGGRARGSGPKQSLAKIEKFCEIARDQMGLQWAWVDTCCIDKSSSAELTEAINAMWKLYKHAAVCVVYLHDVVKATGLEPEPTTTSGPDSRNDPRVNVVDFIESEWFKRGWTLQELLAPSKVRFYDQNWNFLGERGTLAKDIEKATSIKNIRDEMVVTDASIAQRMSWASKRATTKGEDMAYCLFGLFNVNMPIIYGEGRKKAFYRLQLEIIKQSDDESIFAWDAPDDYASGMLAPSPDMFASCGNIVQNRSFGHNRSFHMTNKGLQIHCFARCSSVGCQLGVQNMSSLQQHILVPSSSIIFYSVPLNCGAAWGSGNATIILVGLVNRPRMFRWGGMRETEETRYLPSEHYEDYSNWFHDFRIPQDVSWVGRVAPIVQSWSRRVPGGFDLYEQDMLRNTERRKTENTAKQEAQNSRWRESQR